MAVYYAETTFLFIKWPSTKPLLPRILRWADSWGVQAAPYIRSLIITDQSLSPECDQFHLDFNNPSKPLSYRPGSCPCLLQCISAEDMNALSLVLLRHQGKLEIDVEKLLMLLRAIQGGASGFAAMDAVLHATLLRI